MYRFAFVLVVLLTLIVGACFAVHTVRAERRLPAVGADGGGPAIAVPAWLPGPLVMALFGVGLIGASRLLRRGNQERAERNATARATTPGRLLRVEPARETKSIA